MDNERNLLFGVVAFQSGAVDADTLAESCAAWTAEPTQLLSDLMVHRGLMTDEQKTQVMEAVQLELAAHGGDPHATLAATVDGRSLEALGEAAGAGVLPPVGLAPPRPAAGQGGHVVLGRLSPGELDARERYTLTHLHAKGGMGRVWLARDGALGRQIALKELRPDQSDNAIVCSRFLYEAKITAQLEHPGIVPVYELGEGDAPYYTMRFVRGRTLTEAIRAYHRKRAASEADSVGLVELLQAFANVCHAVAYAHSRGIIHRDLKGQNVVLGDFGEVIVLDWGLAKRVGIDPARAPERADRETAASPDRLDPEAATAVTRAAPRSDHGLTLADDPDGDTSPGPRADGCAASEAGSGHGSNGSAGVNGSGHSAGRSARGVPESGAGPEGTMHGQLLGTPAYMAPEQALARHDQVDQRTDIYGLGAILYEILTGRPPFVAPKTAEIIRKVCNEPPTPPRQIVPEIALGLEAVCLKALRKDKADRYQLASDLAQEVRRYLADEPVQAYAEPWTQLAWRWMRRNRTKVAAAAALLVTAAIALGISTLVVTGERNEAESQGQQARQAVHLLTQGADIAFDDQLDPVQREILQKALTYFEGFTARAAKDPAVRREQGWTYQQMGDVEAKLGRLPESEAAYRKAIATLEPLADDARVGREARRILAQTRTLLGDLLVRRENDRGQGEPLYNLAIEMQQVLADPKKDPAASAEDILRLGQTDKSRGDLLRLDAKLEEAGAAYDRAIAELERALAADAKLTIAQSELALAIDARGWVRRERGQLEDAEKDYRRAIEMLEKLVADFPTISRHREAFARALNSLGAIEETTGRLADAEREYSRELPLAERLIQDFPDRTEFRRVLARTLSNLGNTLAEQHRPTEAEPVLKRAVEVNTEVSGKSPDDIQIRFDLAKDHVGLGDLLREKGDTASAMTSLQAARAINEKLVNEYPDRPRYRELLAQNLVDLAVATEESDPAGADQLYRTAEGLFDKLVAAHPDMVDYRLGQARCLNKQGHALAVVDRNEQAEAVYRRGLAALAVKDAHSGSPDWLRPRAELLANLGDSQVDRGKRAGDIRQAMALYESAVPHIRQAMAIFEPLASAKGASLGDRHSLAALRFNLGDCFFRGKRLKDAEPILDQAEGDYEQLVAAAPKSVDFHYQLGMVQGRKADVLAQTGRLPDAAIVLARAVENQERAVQLSGKHSSMRKLLADHLLALAEVDLKRGAYQEAADDALRASRAAPDTGHGEACFKAAQILARVVKRVGGEPKLVPADRERLTRPHLGRLIVLLRDAIDSDPKLVAQIKSDPDIKDLESRPEFKTLMNSLVELGR